MSASHTKSLPLELLEQQAKSRAHRYYRAIRHLDPAAIDDQIEGFATGYIEGFRAAQAHKSDEETSNG